MRRRFVLPSGALADPPPRLELPRDTARHLEVLRLAVGTDIELTDGDGREVVASLETVGKRGAAVTLGPVRAAPAPGGPELILLQGVGKGDKLDAVVRQVAELGASRLVPVATARAVAKRDNRIDRFRTIAEDALRVARGAWRMHVDPPMPLADALELPADLRLACVVGATVGLAEALKVCPDPRRIAVLVGPEGGFSEDEHRHIEAAGYRDVSLGDRVLRTETAGPAVVAMVRFAFS